MKKRRQCSDRQKSIKYIKNNGSRCSTFCRRSKTIIMNCMELELQTRFRFSLNIKPPLGATNNAKEHSINLLTTIWVKRRPVLSNQF